MANRTANYTAFYVAEPFEEHWGQTPLREY